LVYSVTWSWRQYVPPKHRLKLATWSYIPKCCKSSNTGRGGGGILHRREVRSLTSSRRSSCESLTYRSSLTSFLTARSRSLCTVTQRQAWITICTTCLLSMRNECVTERSSCPLTRLISA
jgi:hypothetical protein